MKVKIKIIKKYFLVAIALLVFIGLFSYYSNSVKAGVNDNVSGWAWSDNIGWISFNSTNLQPSPDFGVNIGADGNMTGYAWSSSIGWIHFDPSGPYPAIPDYSARVNTDGNLLNCGQRGWICGWARACSVFQLNCEGQLRSPEERGGWDGWILMGPYGSPSRSVWLENFEAGSRLRGYAWGSVPIGWIGFNCIDHGNCTQSPFAVTSAYRLNTPPQVSSLSSSLEYCAHTLGMTPRAATGLAVRLSWQFFDLDPNDRQARYEIEIRDSQGSFGVRNIESSAQEHSFDSSAVGWNRELVYGATYQWRVRVFDGRDWSGLSDWNSFAITQTHPSPFVRFSRSPKRISVNEVVSFDALAELTPSQVFGGTPSYHWTFELGNQTTATSSVATTTFIFNQPSIDWWVRLTVSDGTYSCTRSERITVRVPLPDWREIAPFGRVQMFLANIMRAFGL